MHPSLPRIERARPLLGTLVAVRVHGLAPDRAKKAIAAAFAEIAAIHAAMSFHESTSEVSRLNREAHRTSVRVGPHTYAVLRRALQFAEASDGVFDPTIAPVLAEWGLLPIPEGAPPPDRFATWRDITLGRNQRVRFARPLWIDLGGIAKGYAVDCAMTCLKAYRPAQACVNAGGDLAIMGKDPEHVSLLPEARASTFAPIMELANASLASSSGHEARRQVRNLTVGPHVDGRKRKSATTRRFVSVVAPLCIDADALTKIVMADEKGAAALLPRFGARAFLHDRHGWREARAMS